MVIFEYPASLTVRNRIRDGERIPFEDRGKIVEVEVGAITDAPADLLQSWVDAGLVEAPEEAPSPQPSPIKGEGVEGDASQG